MTDCELPLTGLASWFSTSCIKALVIFHILLQFIVSFYQVERDFGLGSSSERERQKMLSAVTLMLLPLFFGIFADAKNPYTEWAEKIRLSKVCRYDDFGKCFYLQLGRNSPFQNLVWN